MISAQEIRQLAAANQVHPSVIERDYVLGWLLWGIYTHPQLREQLILKGGNCLRKAYFPDARFSEDLDFTITQPDAAAIFTTHLPELCQRIQKASGIPMLCGLAQVKPKPTPDGESQAIEGRIYFHSLLAEQKPRPLKSLRRMKVQDEPAKASVTMTIKFDMSQYEQLVLPLQWHPLLHPYSDAAACQALILTYSLEEVLAEKLRSWIQRTRPRDLHDISTIVHSQSIPICIPHILDTFLQKTIFKQVPLAGREEMLYSGKFALVAEHWDKAMMIPPAHQRDAAAAISTFQQFIHDLYNPLVLNEIGIAAAQPTLYRYNIQSGLRETLISAGRAHKMVRIRYQDHERDIEPYSFRYKVTKKGVGAEYFYGFDRSRGATIKSFILHRIQGVSILPQVFEPRWMVEF